MKLLAAALLAAAIPVWAADAKLLGLLMPEARLVAGAQVNQIQGTQLGRWILSHAPVADLEKLKSETGFDPRTDLTEVAAGSVTEGRTMVVGKGAFQPARIQNLAMTHGAKLENYRGVAIIDGAVAFLDGSTVVIGKAEELKPAIDRWLAGVLSTGPLMTKAAALSSTSQAWMAASGLQELYPAAAGPAPPEAQLVRNVLAKIREISGSMQFADGVVLTVQAVTGSGQDAQALADAFQFLLAIAGANSPLPVAPQISASGSTVSLTAEIPQQVIEQFLKPAARLTAAR